MEQSFDLPDSTDWLDTPLSLLAPLESSLRCQVCKDFFDTPVITSCSHTFCSLCIRRCLSTEGKCPTCRSGDQELKLRRNWLVQEILEAFKNARETTLKLAKKEAARIAAGDNRAPEPGPKKRKVSQVDYAEATDAIHRSPQRVRTRSRSQMAQAQTDRHEHNQVSGVPEVIEDSQDEDFVPVADDGMVACPICNRRMKNEAVFAHLDKCTGDPGPALKPAPAKQTSFGSLQPQSRQTPISPSKTPDRLPAMNYSLLKDLQLRRKFRDLGIPDWGPRQLLQRRHTEWMNLWNANCDSTSPKSKKELLRELDIWERTQGGFAPTQSSVVATNTVMAKDFNTAQWSVNHDTDFKRLIENARKKSDAQVRSTIPGAAQPVSEVEGGAPIEINSDPPAPSEMSG
ncbi:Postreplication repair E3 ubiquitin-protein ligase rad18 [Penicillium daleae]|uniref:Postreplication repair E3 ubiquitin-protein ligase RAD18 n=1 Tax=Penicillium daleae TaxID=63821 RepID=A0AAD6C6X7_9EURO|nr:Postreplication repair E3 ubiquitin-protein ligase rad18 [Penicillium daleae]KAJ5453783.1 Postreplication repair E3 ubiquitin-protein ligase rad18 [Penicillium daleae]